MTDKDDLEQRVAKLETRIDRLRDQWRMDWYETHLLLWPHHHDADEWRKDLEEMRERLPESHPAKTGQRLQ